MNNKEIVQKSKDHFSHSPEENCLSIKKRYSKNVCLHHPFKVSDYVSFVPEKKNPKPLNFSRKYSGFCLLKSAQGIFDSASVFLLELEVYFCENVDL